MPNIVLRGHAHMHTHAGPTALPGLLQCMISIIIAKLLFSFYRMNKQATTQSLTHANHYIVDEVVMT